MIHYHGTPIGGKIEDAEKFLAGRHALVSYANQQNMETVAEVCSSFVLDNGAFTFWQRARKAKEKGITVPPPDWDKYLVWVNSWATHPRFAWWLIPDVIDGNELDNFGLMFRYGRKAPFGVPVYHMHESLEHLDRMCNSWDRIALGSSGEWSHPGSASWWVRITEMMEVICDRQGRPRAKLHGLRMLNPKVFVDLPLESADSCNAGRNNHESGRWPTAYTPIDAGRRAAVIGDRIESQQSASEWIFPETFDPDGIFGGACATL